MRKHMGCLDLLELCIMIEQRVKNALDLCVFFD